MLFFQYILNVRYVLDVFLMICLFDFLNFMAFSIVYKTLSFVLSVN